MASITTLEKSVNLYAEQLRAKGHEVKVHTFRAGIANEMHTSFVELQVGGAQPSRFIAYGYTTYGSEDICGDTWTEMKKEFEDHFFA